MGYVILQVIMGICEMTYPAATAGTFEIVMNPEFSNTFVQSLFQTLWKTMWFDYPFFTGAWLIVRYLFMSISIGVIVVMFLQAPMATLMAGGILGAGAGISWLIG